MGETEKPDRSGLRPAAEEIAAVEERKRGEAGARPLEERMDAFEERRPDDSGVERKDEEEVAAYEKLRQEVRRLLADVRENVNAETLKEALESATAGMKEAGGYTVEVLNRAADAVKRDLGRTALKLGPKWSEFSEKSADAFAVWRDHGTHLLGKAAVATGEWLQKTGSRLEHQAYLSGEITYGGTFECASCGEMTVLAQSGRVPACARCKGTEFRRAA
jgi:Zinc-ribbon containing domain